MGTSGSYSGGGGKPGNDLRDRVASWLDSLPGSPPPSDKAEDQSPYLLPPSVISQAIRIFGRQRSPGGGGNGGGSGEGGIASGGGRRAGGAQRSASSSARSAGRAAAAVFAYKTGDRQGLSDLGLNYDELLALDDPLEVVRRIVDAACGSRSESTIEHEEQRMVAAEIATWVLNEEEAGVALRPDQIARKAIAFIVAEAIASETGELIHAGRRPAWVSELAESELRKAIEVYAERADLSVDGVTDAEFAKAIEDGLEKFHVILGWGA